MSSSSRPHSSSNPHGRQSHGGGYLEHPHAVDSPRGSRSSHSRHQSGGSDSYPQYPDPISSVHSSGSSRSEHPGGGYLRHPHADYSSYGSGSPPSENPGSSVSDARESRISADDAEIYILWLSCSIASPREPYIPASVDSIWQLRRLHQQKLSEGKRLAQEIIQRTIGEGQRRVAEIELSFSLETWSDEEFAAVAQKELDYQPLRVLVPTLRIALPSSKLYPDQRDPEKLENFRTRAEASFDMLRTQMPWTHRVMLRMSASRRSREHQVSSPTDCFYVAEDKAIKDPRAWTDWTSGMRRGSLSMRQHGLAS